MFENGATSHKKYVNYIHKVKSYILQFFSGCSSNAEDSACAVDIRIRSIGDGPAFEQYNTYRNGDMKLDWYGREMRQQMHNGIPASGTHLQETSSDPTSEIYHPFNR